jgi:hypothetical protein
MTNHPIALLAVAIVALALFASGLGVSAQEPPAPVECRALCADRARVELDTCQREGGSDDECQARARAVYDQCQAECRPEAVGTPGRNPALVSTRAAVGQCAVDCQDDAAAAYQACLATGRSETDCGNESRRLLARCLASCPHVSGTQTPQSGSACRDNCAQRARRLYQLCLAGGVRETVCAAQARDRFADCAARCGNDPRFVRSATATPGRDPVPPAEDCQARCELHALEAYDACRAAGGTDEDCQFRRDETLRRCVAGCPAPPLP